MLQAKYKDKLNIYFIKGIYINIGENTSWLRKEFDFVLP